MQQKFKTKKITENKRDKRRKWHQRIVKVRPRRPNHVTDNWSWEFPYAWDLLEGYAQEPPYIMKWSFRLTSN